MCDCVSVSVHGRPRAQQLPLDAASGRVCVAGGRDRVQQGVRSVCVPFTGTAVCLLLPGNVTVFNHYYKLVHISLTLDK